VSDVLLFDVVALDPAPWVGRRNGVVSRDGLVQSCPEVMPTRVWAECAQAHQYDVALEPSSYLQGLLGREEFIRCSISLGVDPSYDGRHALRISLGLLGSY
jgi:hypothetical protein